MIGEVVLVALLFLLALVVGYSWVALLRFLVGHDRRALQRLGIVLALLSLLAVALLVGVSYATRG